MTINTSIEEFMKEVAAERAYQVRCWGEGDEDKLDRTDDEKNGPESFTAFIAHHSSRWFPGGFPPHGINTLRAFRVQMIKVAALAYAAVRWTDRRLAEMEATEVTEEKSPDY